MALRTSVWTTAQLHSSVTHSCKPFMQPDRVDCIFINDLLHALHVHAQPRKLGMTAASSKSLSAVQLLAQPEHHFTGTFPGGLWCQETPFLDGVACSGTVWTEPTAGQPDHVSLWHSLLQG